MKPDFFDKAAYGENWTELAAACKKRDNYTCRNCGYQKREGFKNRKLHADHIIPLSKNGKNKLSNLQTLCDRCHETKTNRNRTDAWKVSWSSKTPPKKKHKITRLKRFRPK